MIEFDVETDKGYLGRRQMVAGNTERVHVDLDGFLVRGAVLTGVTATVTSELSTVSTPTISANAKATDFYITSVAVNETFSIGVRVTTSDDQTLNYTTIIECIGPVLSTQTGELPLLYGPTGPTGAGPPRAGNAVLVGGTVTVSNTTVTADTVIVLARKTSGGTLGTVTYTTSVGVGFTITSDNVLDTSTFSYILVEA